MITIGFVPVPISKLSASCPSYRLNWHFLWARRIKSEQDIKLVKTGRIGMNLLVVLQGANVFQMICWIELQHHELDWCSLICVKRFDWIDDTLTHWLAKLGLVTAGPQYCHNSHYCHYCQRITQIISGFCGWGRLICTGWLRWEMMATIELLLRLFVIITRFYLRVPPVFTQDDWD